MIELPPIMTLSTLTLSGIDAAIGPRRARGQPLVEARDDPEQDADDVTDDTEIAPAPRCQTRRWPDATAVLSRLLRLLAASVGAREDAV